MARTTPRVAGATLVARADDARAIAVGTPAWYTWLEGASTFAFAGAAGSFTARKERRRRADGYWKAYRKRAGVVRSAYLGKSADLTLERLQSAAVMLAELPLPGEALLQSDADLAPSGIESSVRVTSALPVGTVTFLFTDIAGSTTLWEQHPQAMPAALARHDRILRQAVAAHHGVVFKTVGDSAHAVFATAPDALSAALSSQRALQAEPWGPIGPLQVRMALHTGVAAERDGDYYGAPLNRLARILALGHGGQILLSLATEELVRDHVPHDTTLHDLGIHHLKDLRHAEQIFQLVSADLPSDFPPLRTLDSPPAPAPVQPVDLLDTKLYVPPVRPQLVPRPRLLARLDRGLTGKLTLLSAPAGFGKTTLLSAWIAHQRLAAGDWRQGESSPASSPQPLAPRVAWVSLDAADSDPLRFWRYVIAALDMLQPDIGATALAQLQSPQPPPIEVVLTPLLNALSTLPTEAVLVLDDYHLIDTLPIHSALAFLLDHLPPQLHLILTTRADPPLPLPRLRARGQLTELRVADLCFTADEATTFLTEVMGLPLSADDVAALETRTEGWITGLQFAALAMRDRTDHASFIAAFTGSHRFIVDYLAEEVFVQQPRHIQTFLLQTSILERLCGSLCDAVLGLETGNWRLGKDVSQPASSFQPPASHAYSQLMLDQLERANLFLIPLDDERCWYRYHHLFAEVIRSRLTSGASAEAVATLHGRASVWYEQQGLVVEAVQHVLAAHDWERAAVLIESNGLSITLRGQVHTVLHWLSVLPDALVRMRPTLCIIHAATLMFADQLDAAEARVQDAERCIQPDMPPDQAQAILGRVAVIRANLVRYFGDLPRAVALAQQALDLLPEADAMVRAPAMVGVARIYLVSGDVTSATERLAAAAVAPARASGNLLAFLSSVTNLARLHMLQGRLRQAAATFGDAMQVAPEPGRLQALGGSPAYYFGLGDLLREWNDLDAAEYHLTQGMDLVGGTLAVDADVVTLGYIVLARVQHARGDSSAALATLEQFASLARVRNFVAQLIACGSAAQVRLWLAQAQLTAAVRWVDASGLHADDRDLPFLREAEYLTFARVQIALQGGAASQALPDTLGLLDRLLLGAEANGRVHSVIEILLVRALALDAQGELTQALSALERALALAEPEGYVRTFVDEGAQMAALLVHVAARELAVAAYATKLLEAFPERLEARDLRLGDPAQASSLQPLASSLIEPLTEREREVLQLIVAGKSNAQIAQALVVAVSTVKAHVNHLFGKLAVTSRTQAIARARELHLL